MFGELPTRRPTPPPGGATRWGALSDYRGGGGWGGGVVGEVRGDGGTLGDQGET